MATLTCILGLGALAACGSDDSDAGAPPTAPATPVTSTTPTAPSTPETPAAPAGKSLDITVRGKEVTPNGQRIKLGVGETFTINVDSDHAGEIHVHSTPEQHLEYGVGTTTLTVTVKTPGIVAVEDHAADITIAQLEVS